MRKKYRPSTQDKDEAARILKNYLGFDKDPYKGASYLRKFLEEYLPGCIETYTSLKNTEENILVEYDDDKIPNLVVDLLDIELLEQKEIRELLLDNVYKRDRKSLRSLAKSQGQEEVWDDYKEEDLFNRLKREKWYGGSNRARKFATFFGFPSIFAGFPSPSRPEYAEVVEKRPKMKQLRIFQENIKNQVMTLLESKDGRKNRGIIRLPTGAGKTRIAAEAALEFWRKNDDVQFVMWIAQSEELCEQAFACFKQLWEENGEDGKALKLFRVYHSGPLPRSDEDGIIIAGIDQLDEFIKPTDQGKNPLAFVSKLIGAVLVDEAHRSISTTYRKVFASIGLELYPTGKEQIPLIGITATPFRNLEKQTRTLLKIYNENILYPNPSYSPNEGIDDNWSKWNDLISMLTEQRILSRPKYYRLETGTSFDMNQPDTDTLETKNLLSKRVLAEVGKNEKRNAAVFHEIMKWAKQKRSILFFGASLNQAVLISKLLNDAGILSAVITGATNPGARLVNIEMFKKKQIQVLCNYEVLTTGFDAPEIDTIIIARPTESRTLYEQMIGRGLRGPEFGGTETCDIITVIDNIFKFDRERVVLGSEEFLNDVFQDMGEDVSNLPKVQAEIPRPGDIFTEKELSNKFGVQIQGGIRYTNKNNFVLLIDSAHGNYIDHVDEKAGMIIYTGAGLIGDQTWTAFNEKIRDSDGKILLYFQKPEPNKIIYKYRVTYVDHFYDNEEDQAGTVRKVIKFRLKIMKD